jgi:TusA-related sulfurtransferase
MIFDYDGTKEQCPVPLVKMRVLLKKMQDGDQCILLIKDSGSITDIPKLLTKQGYSYSQHSTNDGIVRVIVESRPTKTNTK